MLRVCPLRACLQHFYEELLFMPCRDIARDSHKLNSARGKMLKLKAKTPENIPKLLHDKHQRWTQGQGQRE